MDDKLLASGGATKFADAAPLPAARGARMMARGTRSGTGLLVSAGVAVIAVAAVVSNQAIERALLGGASGALDWGPTLFRCLLVFHGALLVIAGVVHGQPVAAKRSALLGRADGDAAQEAVPWGVLILMSVFALGLRLWSLNADLWHDEVATLLDYVRPPVGQIVTQFGSQNQHMLYSLLAHASVQVFGETAAALRLPSVLFGIGSLWALFLLGRQLIGRRDALLACALMTVSYHHVWFSQNARGYTGLLFFATLATWLWIEALPRTRWSWWLGYATAVSLGLWIHMTMAFVLASHAILSIVWTVARYQERARSEDRASDGAAHSLAQLWMPVLSWVLCVTLTLQLYALSLPEFLRTALHQVSLPSEWSSPWWVVQETLRGLRMGAPTAVVVLGGVAFLGVGWLRIAQRNGYAALALILPPLLGGTTMLVLNHYLWPRFFFFAMGFVLLIIVRGATTLPGLIVRRVGAARLDARYGNAAGVALAGAIIVASALTVPRNYTLPKQDFSGARDYVERNREPGDIVVAVGVAGPDYLRYFAPSWSMAETRADLDAIRNHAATVWLVYTLQIQVKAYYPEIWDVIEKDFEVVKVFPGTLGGGEVYVYRQRGGSAGRTARNAS